MKNMFYNYDHPHHNKNITNYDNSIPTVLNNDLDPFVLLDIKGNEIGISARRGSELDIYFNLSGYVADSTIEEFITNSVIEFSLVDRQYQHTKVFTRIFDGTKCFVGSEDLGSIIIHLDDTDEGWTDLELNSYRVNLIVYPNELNKYIIYPDNCGLLILR